MLPNLGYNVRVLHPLIKIPQMFEVREVLLFICHLQEGDRNVFTSDPFIEVIFNLDSEYISHDEESKYKDLQLSRQAQSLTMKAFHLRKTHTMPSSFFPWNQVLLMSIWMTGARNMPVFCSMFYSGGASCQRLGCSQ